MEREDEFLRRAEALARRRSEAEALDVLGQAARLFPGSVRVPVWTGLLLERLGRREDALAAYVLAVDGRTPPPGQSGDVDHYCRFLALLRAGRFADAGRLDQEHGEDGAWNLILHEPGAPGGPIPFLPPGFHQTQLRELARVAAPADAPWAAFYRVLFLSALGRRAAALKASAKLTRLPAKRYGWMRYAAGALLLRAGRYREAERELRAALRSGRRPWHARCLLAETLLCTGRERAALSLIDGFEAGAASGDALAWRGELLLWTGRYAEAADVLALAADSNSRFAAVWLAAVRLLEGDLGESSRLFDAVPAHRLDAEALVWRSELMLKLGRLDEARRDADAALSADPKIYWAVLLRIRAGLPESSRRGLPPPVARFLRGRGEAAIDEVFARARGLRRPERYLLPLLDRALTGGAKTSRKRG